MSFYNMFIYPRIFRLPIKQLVFPIFPFLTSGIVQYFGQTQRTSQVERKTKCSKKPTATDTVTKVCLPSCDYALDPKT